MNNLKRVFSLALTGVMLSGMMVMGASATDFPDDEKIVNQEAVDSCVALSIINGRDDGSFDPEGLVTRAEMAKMIATAVNGGIAPEFGVKTTPTYTDIADCWAEQYIEYCSDMKYIAGRGDGTFNPYGNVTGVEAAKMILTALGYDAEAYQLVGADWAINTTFFATRNCKPSLYEDLNKVNMNAAITRDVAAQMIWNGMQNVYVEYTPTLQVTGGSLSHGYGPNANNDTLLEQAYDAHITVAQFTGNKNTDSLKAGQIEVTTTADSDPRNVAGSPGDKVITADLDIAHLGETVKVIWKDEKNTTNGLDFKDKIYGVYPTGETEVVHAILADVKDNKAAEAKIKVGDTKYDLADTVKLVTNYGNTADATYAKNDASGKATNNGVKDTSNSDLTDDLKKSTGDSLKLILTDGKVTDIYVVESKLGVVTSKNSEKIIVKTGTTSKSVKIADNEVYEGVAKDDVVVLTVLYSGDEELSIVEKAEKVSGTVKGYKTTGTTPNFKYETVTLDSTAYKIYGQAKMTKIDSTDPDEFTGPSIGEDFDLFLVNGFVAAAQQTSEAATNYSIVIDVKATATAGSTFDALQVQLLGADGTKSIYTVSDKSDEDGTNDGIGTDDYPAGTLVTYTIDKDGNAKLKYADNIKSGGTASNKDVPAALSAGYVKKTKSFNGATTTADCVLFVCEKASSPKPGDFKVYKIRELDDIAVSSETGLVATNDDGNVVAAYIALGKAPDGATDETVYGIVKSNEGTVKPSSTAYNRYIVSVAGEDVTVDIEADGSNDTLTTGDVVSFKPTKDGTYSDNTSFTPVSADVNISAETGTIAMGYGKSWNEADSLISIYTKVTGAGTPAVYTGSDVLNAVVKDDADFYYINKDGKVSEADGAVNDSFDTQADKKNMILIGEWTGTTVGSKVFEVSVVISEIDGTKGF